MLAAIWPDFPNGRRLEDDVVDIELQAMAQGYGPVLEGLLGLPNKSPNNLVGDGVDATTSHSCSSFRMPRTASGLRRPLKWAPSMTMPFRSVFQSCRRAPGRQS